MYKLLSKRYNNTRITLLAPVSSVTVEKANSALKFVKNDRRTSTGEDRLNALILLFVHREIAVDINEVILLLTYIYC